MKVGKKLQGALKVDLKFYFKKPKDFEKRKSKYCTKRPDLDNLEKAVLDALNEVAFDDDAQIVEVHKIKDYGDKNLIFIEIEELEKE